MTRIDRMGCACGSPMCVPGGRGGEGVGLPADADSEGGGEGLCAWPRTPMGRVVTRGQYVAANAETEGSTASCTASFAIRSFHVCFHHCRRPQERARGPSTLRVTFVAPRGGFFI